jgi:hypothetical protein
MRQNGGAIDHGWLLDGEFSAAASSNNADLFEIMKVASIISATGPQSHGRGYPSYSSGSLPASNASVVSSNIIMLTVQSLQ